MARRLSAIRQLYRFLYAEGCRFTDKSQDWHGWFGGNYGDNVQLIDPQTQQDKIKEAVAVARQSALETVRQDPGLRRAPALARAVRERWGERLALAGVG